MIDREKLEEALGRCQENEEGSFFCLADADTFVSVAREYAKILPHLDSMMKSDKMSDLLQSYNDLSKVMKGIGDE